MQVCHIGSWNVVVGACSTMIVELQITTYKHEVIFSSISKAFDLLASFASLLCYFHFVYIWTLCLQLCNKFLLTNLCVVIFTVFFLLLLFFCILGKFSIDLQ
jgi:hypothetical protein